LQSEDELIDFAVNLSTEDWSRLCTQLMWLHRRGGLADELPPVLNGVADLAVDHESWSQVRRRVRVLRLAKSRQDKAEREANAEQGRREYMRVYMSRRRRKDRRL
jgi:hypothetical protein